jgi:hypothetical protein
MSANERAEAFLLVIKRLAKWAAIGIAGLLMLVLIFYVYTEAKDYYDNRPKVVTEVKGIILGEKLNDVIFKVDGFVLEKDQTDLAEGESRYANNDLKLYMRVINGRANIISYECKEESDNYSINGIACFSTGESVAEKFGAELRVRCMKDKESERHQKLRVYEVGKFGVRYHLWFNKVRAFTVTAPSNMDVWSSKNWIECE